MIEDEIMERVDKLCQKYNISKYRLSKLTGISQSSLSKMSKKQSTLSIITLEKICSAFGITLAQFFSNEDSYPDLSEDQLHLLQEWSALEPKQKEFLLAMIKQLKNL
ncbi:MAG: helix-turn-helix transcriptional regulator [Anaerotignum sp.]|nr:helix-turn-helix transcriptional regulator [Anaerotignum sp.]